MTHTAPDAAGRSGRRIGRPHRAVTEGFDETLLDLVREAVRAADFGAVSLDALAMRIGVSKPTIYRRFESRSALLEAVVERQLALLLAEADAAPERPDPLGRLRDYARRLFAAFLDPASANFTRFLMQEAAANPRLIQLRRDWHQRVLDRIGGLLAEAHAAGAIARQDHAAQANLLVDLLYTPLTLRPMGFAEAELLSGATADAFFAVRFDLFLASLSSRD